MPRFAPGTTPSPPTSPAHRSLITSPNRFSITSTSNLVGSSTSSRQTLSIGFSSNCDERELVGDFAGTLKEQAVSHAHHVGLVAEGHFAAPLIASQFERIAHDPLRRGARNHAQTFHDTGHDDVLQPGIEPLGVLADDNEIDILERRLHSRQGLHRPHTGIKVQPLPQS